MARNLNRRIVIELGDHATDEEVTEILEELWRIGIDAKYEDEKTNDLRKAAAELGIEL